jgi:hypothetical protein
VSAEVVAFYSSLKAYAIN